MAEISAEEFAAWREDPVTEWVSAALRERGDAQMTAWIRLSWDGGNCDPMKLCELRMTADAYHALADFVFEDFAPPKEEA